MKWVVQLLMFLLSNTLVGQDFPIIKNGLINRILIGKENIEISGTQTRQDQIIKLEKFFSNYNQSIIKNKKGTFILVDGTGRVFRVASQQKDTVHFQRIDSTHFYGYNGAAIVFSYKDTLFSFGGEGYWRTNGQLRFFSEKSNEWDLLPLNEEISAINTLFYFDKSSNELFYVQAPITNHATNKKTEDYVLYKLNMANRENTRLGVLNNMFSSIMPTPRGYGFIPIKSLNSLLVNFDSNNQYLIDFKNNKVKKLNSIRLQKTFYGNSKGIECINSFEINNWIYYTQSNDTTMQLDSVRISQADFTPIDEKFYIPEKQNQLTYIFGSIGLLILSSIVIYVQIRKRKKIFTTKEDISNGPTDIENFKSIELELIEKIYKKSLEGKSYSVEDINAALGLSKKSLEIQKKIRTETINRINHRFKLKFNTEEDLIERIRLEEDRRFYKYNINEENGKKALGL